MIARGARDGRNMASHGGKCNKHAMLDQTGTLTCCVALHARLAAQRCLAGGRMVGISWAARVRRVIQIEATRRRNVYLVYINATRPDGRPLAAPPLPHAADAPEGENSPRGAPNTLGTHLAS